MFPDEILLPTEDLIENVGPTRAIAITILDLFENLLDKHGIYIPDDDRSGDEGEACLYGTTYGNLEDAICTILYEYIDE